MNAVVLIVIICLGLPSWLNMHPDFSNITVFLKIRNIISENRRSKVTDFAALKDVH